MVSKVNFITASDKKAFLNSYVQAKNDIKRLELQLEELRTQRVSYRAVDDGKAGSDYQIKLSVYTMKINEIEQEILYAKYRKVCMLQQVRNSVEALENEREKTLLTYRYLKQMKWEDVAVSMMFSLQHIHKIHTKALMHFAIIY